MNWLVALVGYILRDQIFFVIGSLIVFFVFKCESVTKTAEHNLGLVHV